ncbi:MAG: hypothetical protein M1826_000306 [Phylliscum demangeonii]|nr:MAG: hypothetical protein M1826_000306 [Phylliscum demangeonii]
MSLFVILLLTTPSAITTFSNLRKMFLALAHRHAHFPRLSIELEGQLSGYHGADVIVDPGARRSSVRWDSHSTGSFHESALRSRETYPSSTSLRGVYSPTSGSYGGVTLGSGDRMSSPLAAQRPPLHQQMMTSNSAPSSDPSFGAASVERRSPLDRMDLGPAARSRPILDRSALYMSGAVGGPPSEPDEWSSYLAPRPALKGYTFTSVAPNALPVQMHAAMIFHQTLATKPLPAPPPPSKLPSETHPLLERGLS